MLLLIDDIQAYVMMFITVVIISMTTNIYADTKAQPQQLGKMLS